MTSKTKTTGQKGATTLSISEEAVADGRAFKDAGGSYSEFLVIYEEPGAKGFRTCGRAITDAHGNEHPCLKKQGAKQVMVCDISVEEAGGYRNVLHCPCTTCYGESKKEEKKKEKLDKLREKNGGEMDGDLGKRVATLIIASEPALPC